MKPWMGLACAMVAVVTAQGAEPTVGNTASARREGSEYTIYQGEIELPTGGTWRVVSTGDNVRQAYLTTEDAANNDEDVMGRRMAEALHAERNQMPQYALRNLYLPCQQHAQSHTNTGPSSFSNMVDSACLAFAQSHTNGRPAALTNQINNTRRALIATTIANPWQYDRHSPKVNLEGPFFFLIPNVEFAFDKFRTTVIEHEDRKPLVLELHPYLDDGMQWVLFTDGACERVLIDPALVKAYNLTILPVQKTAAATKTIVGMRLWQVLAMQKGAGHIPLVLENSATTQRVSLTWNVSHAEESGNAALAAFDRARAQCWQVMLLAGEPPMVMKTWLALANARTEEDSRPGRGRGEATSLFNVLGGRAAVEETLQLKLLSKGDHKADAPPIPVGTLTGVEVKAHPYEELLKGAPGGNLPLALVAPTNRLFVYVAWPEWTISLLNQGGDFLSRGSTVGTGSPVEYHLLGRYLGRFGMDEQWMETVLKAGLIQEMALFVPDLFFLDGTEMTVVCRLKNSLLMTPMLKLLGVAGLGADNIATVPLKNGRNAYWALHEDLLWVGTSRSELEQGLALQKTGGKDSLGQSAEFRYMLTQLPVTAATRGYVYCSDPFIRRLTGPAVKIGQMRRILARADMERLTATALLAKMDGVPPAAIAAQIKTNFPGADYTIDRDLIAHAQTWGTLAQMKTLLEAPVDLVTADEQQAYAQYKSEYTRFWRQFFDPIAMRLDDAPDGSLALEVFVLPLIDNSIYNGLKGVVASREKDAVMRVPVLSPKPVLSFSVNLREESWRDMSKGISEFLLHYAHLSPAILDDLGPELHAALLDADPVIALGSGDILGAFNANLNEFGRSREMLFIPLAASVLTRPVVLMAETRNPARTLKFLQQAASPGTAAKPQEFNRDELAVQYYQIERKNAWVLSASIAGFIKLRFGIELQGNYLLVRNIPWSSKDCIERVETTALNGACLGVTPGACQAQLPSLFAAAADRWRMAAIEGNGYLYPLLASGYARIDDAAEAHARLFGFQPAHPAGGQWRWETGEVVSSLYGSAGHQKQPAYQDGDRSFGVLKEIAHLDVSMQFEDTGLRTRVCWQPK